VVAVKLTAAGYTVITASDGEEGYELARQHRPDLIITDLQMPYLTGVQMCRKLRETPETSTIPALLLTARGFGLSPEDLATTNVLEMLTKPFSPREVLDKVAQVLGAGPGARTPGEH
jgi:two-component system alkaline phosphatase synthesis response regulator PhoP